jgi:hypothetical protein
MLLQVKPFFSNSLADVRDVMREARHGLDENARKIVTVAVSARLCFGSFMLCQLRGEELSDWQL